MRLTEEQVYNLAYNTLGQFQRDFKFNRGEMARVLTAICFVESTYNANATNSKSSAKGLMQVIDGTRKDVERWLGLQSSPDSLMFNPQYNMLIGARYFLQQWRRYSGNLKQSVIAYNQGSYNTSKDGADYWAKFERAYKMINPVLAGANYLQMALLLSVGIGTIYYFYKN